MYDLIVKGSFELDMFIGTAMYSVYGSLSESWKVFNMLQTQDVVAWSAMITAYCQHGDGNSAAELFKKMHLLGLKPDKIMISAIIKAYTLQRNLVQCMLIHHETTHDGFDNDCIVRHTLINMYAK